jgi:hypothetical protein
LPGGFSDGIAINRFVRSSIAGSESRWRSRIESCLAFAVANSLVVLFVSICIFERDGVSPVAPGTILLTSQIALHKGRYAVGLQAPWSAEQGFVPRM